MMKTITGTELRGYLTYPNQYGKPGPGTADEIKWSRGWARAQAEHMNNQKSDYHLSLENDALLGRDSYSAQYRDTNSFEF